MWILSVKKVNKRIYQGLTKPNFTDIFRKKPKLAGAPCRVYWMSASLPKCAISIASHILLRCTKPKKLSMHWAALECHKKESKLHREQKVWINKTENPFKLIFQTKNSLKLKNLDVNFASKKGKQANLSGPDLTHWNLK